MLYGIVWKNFRGNIKNFLAFFSATIVTVGVMFLMMYLGVAVRNVEYTGVFLYQKMSELQPFFNMLTPVIGVIGLAVIAYAVQFYIASRMKDYGMLKVLGIREKDMKKMLVAEYGLGCAISCGLGVALGKAASLGIGAMLKAILGSAFVGEIDMSKVYKYTLGICLLMIFLSMLIISIVLAEKDVSDVLKGTAVKEGRVVSKKAWIFLTVGIVLMCLSFFGIYFLEDMRVQQYLFVLACVGFAVSFLFGTGVLFERYRKGKRYFCRLLVWNEIYHYFRSNKYMVLIQTMVGVIVIMFTFLFAPSVIEGADAEWEGPREVVCVYEDGVDIKRQIEENYDVTSVEIPFVGVFGEGYGEDRTGISESSYNAYFGGAEHLAENEIISLLEIDGVSSLVMDETTMESPRLYFGFEKNQSDGDDPKYIVRDERLETHQGFDFAGLVVMADSVFQKAASSGGQKQMLLLNVKDDDLESLTTWLTSMQGEEVEAVFSKQTEIERGRKEFALTLALLLVVDFAILFFGMFIQGLKLFADSERTRGKYTLLNTAGMRAKEQRRTLKREWSIPVRVESLCAVFLSGAFCFVKIWQLAYEGNVAAAFHNGALLFGLTAVILAAYLVLQYVFLVILRHFGMKRLLQRSDGL